MKKTIIALFIILSIVGTVVFIIKKNYIKKNFDAFINQDALQDEKNIIQDDIQEKGIDVVANESRMKARDARRVSNIKQLIVFLSDYKEQFGSYPKELLQLDAMLSDTDMQYYLYGPSVDGAPNEAILYHYSVNIDDNSEVISYHLGVSLEITNPDKPYGGIKEERDSDFNSKAEGWYNGFIGDDTVPCKPNDVGKSCFDIKVENQAMM